VSARSFSFPSTALVTGGASGIGAAIVARLEAEGTEVASLDLADGFDVSDPSAWEDVGPVELACLNAGVTSRDESVEDYRRVLGANVDGVVFGIRRLAPLMQAGSAIVVTASLAGFVPVESDPVYALTKHAVLGFARSAALRYDHVRINAVCPGIVDTPMTAAFRGGLDAEGFPLIAPEAVAEAVILAARDERTGQAWIVQPGREPERFRFPGVPGPRTPGAEGRVPRLGS
jgi:NAD(P)-dependent dehydrogenase (short-subunit alcohol dehydrogenase family)